MHQTHRHVRLCNESRTDERADRAFEVKIAELI